MQSLAMIWHERRVYSLPSLNWQLISYFPPLYSHWPTELRPLMWLSNNDHWYFIHISNESHYIIQLEPIHTACIWYKFWKNMLCTSLTLKRYSRVETAAMDQHGIWFIIGLLFTAIIQHRIKSIFNIHSNYQLNQLNSI